MPSPLKSKREQTRAQVLTLKREGLSNVTIAKALKCSESGVRYILQTFTPDDLVHHQGAGRPSKMTPRCVSPTWFEFGFQTWPLPLPGTSALYWP